MNLAFETAPLSQQVADELRTAILKGDIRDGQRLQLAELESAFGISRTPIKEGLMMLEHEGLVQHERNKDFIVVGMSESYINDYYDLRKVFEAAAIKAACRNHEDLSPLLAIQQKMENAIKGAKVDSSLYRQYDIDFHATLWKLSGNTRFIGFLRTLFHGPSVSMFEDPTPHWKLSLKEHRAILEAMREGDAEKAVSLNDAHQERCRARLSDAWKRKQQEGRNGQA